MVRRDTNTKVNTWKTQTTFYYVVVEKTLMLIFLSLLSAFNRRMYCDCVRVVQSNLTALYLFFLFLFLFVMYVYISCKVWRKFTESDEIFLSVVSLTIIFSCLRVVQKFKTTTEILTLRHTFSSCYIEIRILCCRCHDINSKRRRRRKT